MHSSYKVIKSNYVYEKGAVEIDTAAVIEPYVEDELEGYSDEFSSYNNEEYELLKFRGKQIIENAESKASEIISLANEKVEEIIYEAKEEGFKKGYEEGYDIGYREAYEKALEEGNKRAEEIIANASYIMYQAKEEYNKFLVEKENGIRSIIVRSVETMLKKELENEKALDKLLFDILSEEKDNKVLLIRVASKYETHLSEVIDEFKYSIGIKGDVVILIDNELQDGTLVVEKDNGKVTFTLENGIEKLTEVLKEI